MGRSTISIVAASALLAGCSTSPLDRDPGLEGLAIQSIQPPLAVPGTRFVLAGQSFVDPSWGESRLVIAGDLDGQGIEISTPVEFVDFDEITAVVDEDFLAQLGAASGDLDGTVTLEVVSAVDGETYRSNSLAVNLSFREFLQPRVDRIDTEQLIFVNDKIVVEGDGFLLSEGEGETVALIRGCFMDAEAGSECVDVTPLEVPLVPSDPFDRTRATFAFQPAIAGIRPGIFDGDVVVRNRQPAAENDAARHEVIYEISEPTVFQLSPEAASLGQFVDIAGGGFVGGDGGGLTLLELSGQFTPTGATDAVPVDLVLVPEFIEGRLVRYVVNEDDALGQAVDLRRVTGSYVGTVTPIVSYEADEIRGVSADFQLGIAPVKQVVFLNFRPSYVESLRHFGLRAVDAAIRQRIREVITRDYETVNLEVRLERPTDFSLYAEVEVGGPDPNGLGLLGYDNTPGKDTGNLRLFDRIGGVNATTQEDGFPGFGGVFIESLFAFSQHPGSLAEAAATATPVFDQIFDPFRPDQGGAPVLAADLGGGQVPTRSSGEGCPATDRADRISCAIWVLGNLVGTTLSHEVGHSLGLANPFGEGFHNTSDEINRLMDAGGDRPFNERAELSGEGPARFCVTEYDYLRQILPTGAPADTSERPSCF